MVLVTPSRLLTSDFRKQRVEAVDFEYLWIRFTLNFWCAALEGGHLQINGDRTSFTFKTYA